MFPRFKRSIKHRRPDLAARQQQAAGKQNRAAFIKPYLRPEEEGVTKRISKAECRGSARLKLNPAIDPVRELVPVVFMSEGGEKPSWRLSARGSSPSVTENSRPHKPSRVEAAHRRAPQVVSTRRNKIRGTACPVFLVRLAF